MKRYSLLLLTLLPLFALAQNSVPTLSNVSALADTVNHQLRVFYDLADAESEDCEVFLRVSSNDTSFTVNVAGAYGDLGFPISPGTGYMIIWDYGVTHHPAVLDYEVKVVADDQYQIDVQSLVDQVDSNRIWNDLAWIEGIRHHSANPTHWLAVRDTLNARFNSFGLETWNQDFTFSGINAANVIGRLPGCTDEQLTIINDAHFDGVANAPGADDNGTGVVAVLEAARILSQYDFAKNLRFIGFDLEETGIVGSARYVADGGIQDWETIEAVLNYEMIGYYKEEDSTQVFPNGFDQLFPAAYDSMVTANWKGNFLANVANVPSDWLRAHYDSVAAIYVPQLRVISIATPGTGVFTPDLRRSDHSRFWDAQIPALMLTDAAEFRNPNYHTPQDVMDSLDLNFLTNNCKATLANLAVLADIKHCGSAVEPVQVNPATGIGYELPCDFKLVPNPTKAGETLRLAFADCADWQNSLISVFDLQGKQIVKPSVAGDSPTLRLPEGVYVVVVELPDGSKAHRRVAVLK